MYTLGVDLGTTFTAAAISRQGRVEPVSLGAQSASIPSAVHMRPDGTTLVGEAALRRGRDDPLGLARHFKRRMGDKAPILLSGREVRPEELTATLLRHVIDLVTEREGEPPDAVAVTHPANWGDYKRGTMREAIALAGHAEATLITEPEAAAIAYATRGRIDIDDIVAVYDLGGGTFDVALLRRTASGFDIVGQPGGIEHLGGIDFDFAVRSWALEQADIEPEELGDDTDDARVRASAVTSESEGAKIALSSDTDATLEMIVDGERRPWRLSRTEFEAMVRPSIDMTIGAVRRTLEAADLEASDIDKVLLVGGSSRIPLIGAMLSETFGRPVAIDADPKAAICGGAALAVDPTLVKPSSPPAFPPPAAGVAAATPPPPHLDPPATPVSAVAPEPTVTAAAPQSDVPTEAATSVAPLPTLGEPASSDGSDDAKGRPPWPLIAGAVAAAVLVIVGILALTGGDDPEDVSTSSGPTQPEVAETTTSSTTETSLPPIDSTVPLVDPVAPASSAEEILFAEDFFNRTYTLDCFGAGTVTLVGGGFEDPSQGLFVAANDVIIRDFDGDGVSEAVVLFGCFFGANGNTDQAQIFEVFGDQVLQSGNQLIAEEGFIRFDEGLFEFIQDTPNDPSEPSCCITAFREEGFAIVDDGSGGTFVSTGVTVVPA